MKRKLAEQYFRCTRLSAVLTRGSCARSHQIAHVPGPKVGREAINVAAAYRCKGCAVGAEHRRGGCSAPPVQLVAVRTTRITRLRRCLACGLTLEHGDYRKNYCNLACYSAGARLTDIERQAEVSV